MAYTIQRQPPLRKDNPFYTSRGDLSAYGLACGYVQRKNGLSLSQEHGVYHIQGWLADKSQVWETSYNLTEARKIFADLAKKA